MSYEQCQKHGCDATNGCKACDAAAPQWRIAWVASAPEATCTLAGGDGECLPSFLKLKRADVDALIEDLRPFSSSPLSAFVLPRHGCVLEELEADMISQALERTQGNQSAAARLLGISRYAFRYRAHKHGFISVKP